MPTGAKRSVGTCCSSSAASNLDGSAPVPFVIPTRISCHALLDKAACAPFCQGKAHEVRQRHQLPQEIRGSVAEGSAAQRTSPGYVLNPRINHYSLAGSTFLRLNDSRTVFKITYNTGMKIKFSTVETNIPPTTVVPTERRPIAPAPVAK
jgi:hypothetical protein